MARIRLNALNPKEIIFEHKEELVSCLFDRFYSEYHKDGENLEEQYQVFINGHLIERDFWAYTKITEKDEVLIALVPGSGSFGSILKQAAIITATVVAAYFTAGSSLAVQASVAVAVSVGTTLLMNALIPPEAVGTDNGYDLYSSSGSQTYSISGQSNQVKKFSIVPKVYGTHRMYPVIAAAPYTDFMTDKNTGELVSYFYCIYDFGLGHYNVSDIKIGETPIFNFNDFDYNFIDFNLDESESYEWINKYKKELSFYRGDVNQDPVSVVLNTNKEDTGAIEDEYSAIRSADNSSNGDNQEINLTFAFPKGLVTYATSGATGDRTVELNVQFREVGAEDWYGFNDLNQVYSFDVVGGKSAIENSKFLFINRQNHEIREFPYYQLMRSTVVSKYVEEQKFGNCADDGPYSTHVYYYEEYGLKKGNKVFYSELYINVDSYVSYSGNIIGQIETRESVSGGYKYTLYNGLPYDIIIFSDYTKVTHDNYFNKTYYNSHTIDCLGKTIQLRDFFDVVATTAGVFRITEDNPEVVYATLKFLPKTKNQIEIKVTRVRSYHGYDFKIQDEMTWLYLTTRYERDPIKTDKNHTFLEIRIKATDQLNGTLKNLNAVCSSILDYYDPADDTWKKKETNNPAWIFVDILTGQINKNAIGKNRIDTNSIVEWANFCDEIPTGINPDTFTEKRFQANFVLDYAITVSDFINQLTSSAQAGLNIINGKYGVLIDKRKTIPVQVFTPRNSWAFRSTRNYAELPDGFKVKYIDSFTDWSMKEAIVYNDGFDENTAVNFEELNTFGVTNFEQAWRYGRYMLAQAKLRQENISIQVDFENLVCTRGDYVLFQNDIMKVGGTAARVVAVNSNRVTIDAPISTNSSLSYGYTYRSITGELKTSTLDPVDSTNFDLNGDIPSVGDIIIIGEVSKITIDLIVKSIIPNSDLTATIELVEKADAIHDAERLQNIPDYDPKISKTVDTELTAPAEVKDLTVLDNTWECKNGDYEYYINLYWNTPDGSVVDVYEIYADNGKGMNLVDYSSTTKFKYIVDKKFIGIEHSFKVLGVAANGKKLPLGEVTAVAATPEKKNDPPSDVDGLYINVLNETLQLDWKKIDDCDVESYMIRYSPSLESSWESSIPLQTVNKETSLASFQARTGSYFIKAIDWNGNESLNAKKAITSIPSLVNLNIIEETNDFPQLNGTKDRVEIFGESLILKQKENGDPNNIEYYPEGYYYFDRFLDLGEIYSCRIQSLVEAEGYTEQDIIANWNTLAEVALMANSRTSEWNVETEYRATDQMNVIAGWTTMDSIDPISEGSQEKWTEWRKFTIGDFTGRIFQFRIKLVSNKPSVSPRVFNGVIRSDMPDRTEIYNNIVAPVGGINIVYNPPFKGPGVTPLISISQDNPESGDVYEITAKTLSGFHIKFKDKDGIEVSRQFDAIAKGYGRKYNEIL